MDVLYLILLVGSLAFGLEALLIGLGGKLMALYRRKRGKTLALASAVGLGIVIPAVVTSMVFALEPLYVCVLVLAYMFIASELVSVFGRRLVSVRPLPPPPETPEIEVVTRLRKRGFGKLVKKKRRAK